MIIIDNNYNYVIQITILFLFGFCFNSLLMINLYNFRYDYKLISLIATLYLIVKTIVKRRSFCPSVGGMAGVVKTLVWLVFSCIHCLFWIPIIIVTAAIIWGYYVYIYLINITAAGEGGTALQNYHNVLCVVSRYPGEATSIKK